MVLQFKPQLVWGWAYGLQNSSGPLITTGLRALKTLIKHTDFNVKLTGGIQISISLL